MRRREISTPTTAKALVASTMAPAVSMGGLREQVAQLTQLVEEREREEAEMRASCAQLRDSCASLLEANRMRLAEAAAAEEEMREHISALRRAQQEQRDNWSETKARYEKQKAQLRRFAKTRKRRRAKRGLRLWRSRVEDMLEQEELLRLAQEQHVRAAHARALRRWRNRARASRVQRKEQQRTAYMHHRKNLIYVFRLWCFRVRSTQAERDKLADVQRGRTIAVVRRIVRQWHGRARSRRTQRTQEVAVRTTYARKQMAHHLRIWKLRIRDAGQRRRKLDAREDMRRKLAVRHSFTLWHSKARAQTQRRSRRESAGTEGTRNRLKRLMNRWHARARARARKRHGKKHALQLALHAREQELARLVEEMNYKSSAIAELEQALHTQRAQLDVLKTEKHQFEELATMQAVQRLHESVKSRSGVLDYKAGLVQELTPQVLRMREQIRTVNQQAHQLTGDVEDQERRSRTAVRSLQAQLGEATARTAALTEIVTEKQQRSLLLEAEVLRRDPTRAATENSNHPA